MKLSEFHMKRSLASDRPTLPTKKRTYDLKEIHKTLVNDRVRTDYDTLNQDKEEPKQRIVSSKKEGNQMDKARFRSKSQLSDCRLSVYDSSRKKTSQPHAPINIFISVEKLNKVRIGHSQRRKSSRKSDMFSMDYAHQRNNHSLDDQAKRNIKLYLDIPRRKNESLKDTIRYPKKNSSIGGRQLKTIEDSDLVHKSLEKKRDQTPPKDNQKLKYEQLKHDNVRFPAGFKKYKLLGRGGFSLVWLGLHKKSKKFYAVKQILTTNKYQTHLKQIWFSNFFFLNGQPRPEYEKHCGIDNMLIMYDYEIQQLDTWIIYELCDGSLGGYLYDLYKDDTDKNRGYFIRYKTPYLKMRENPDHLKHLIIEIAKVLCLLSQNNIVHSDVKTQNILIKEGKLGMDSCSYKLIDYGSSFLFTNLKQYTLATPEYMCPQLLNYILYQNKHEYNKEMLKLLKDYNNLSAIDVWGLGCIILEIINGLPLWMTVNTTIEYKGEEIVKKGLFSVENRSFSRIIMKQLDIIENLDDFFQNENYSCIALDDQLKKIVKRILDPDPNTRIRPREILQEFDVPLTTTIEL